ncbi:MAG: death-on-curing protein [Alphaproteobacteria bacterium]|nr:MAG: death-on-curing protein [Alphaproteobacteria bacterium]
MTEPIWLLDSIVLAMHDEQLAEHGGAQGIRDRGMLESALARPKNLFAYGEGDLCALAAAYAFGIARNHPFVDANKRTALLAAYTFLRINGQELVASETDAVATMFALAAAEIDDRAVAEWLRANTRTL